MIMVNEELRKWAENKSAEGYSPDQIKEALIKEGYTTEEINEAMNIENNNSIIAPVSVTMPKRNKILPIIIIGIIVLILISAGLYFFVFNNERSVSENVNSATQKDINLVDENGDNFGQMHIDVNVDMEVVTEEGYEDFKQKFASCQSASVESKLFETITYYYEIIGPKEGLCEVKSKFTANPNPEWVNKEMICLYDNSLDFETAVQDMSRCSGELYDLMTNPGSYQ
ncbi:MAG TPA: hypothetical protein PLK55_03065 [archaeon]|nr:hypothetical protein [archaeon]